MPGRRRCGNAGTEVRSAARSWSPDLPHEGTGGTLRRFPARGRHPQRPAKPAHPDSELVTRPKNGAGPWAAWADTSAGGWNCSSSHVTEILPIAEAHPLRVPLAAPRTHRVDSDDGTGAVPDRGSEPLPRPREPGCLSAGGRTVPFRRQVSLTETGIPRRGATDRWGAATHARAGAGRTITANMLVAAWTIRKAQGSGRFVHRL
jgi:hypothetical protein